MVDENTASTTNNILDHIQHLKEQERAAAAATSISSAPITSGPEAMLTLPDSHLSDIPEGPSNFLSTLPS